MSWPLATGPWAQGLTFPHLYQDGPQFPHMTLLGAARIRGVNCGDHAEVSRVW